MAWTIRDRWKKALCRTRALRRNVSLFRNRNMLWKSGLYRRNVLLHRHRRSAPSGLDRNWPLWGIPSSSLRQMWVRCVCPVLRPVDWICKRHRPIRYIPKLHRETFRRIGWSHCVIHRRCCSRFPGIWHREGIHLTYRNNRQCPIKGQWNYII